MAIHSTSLRNPPPLAVMADGVEFYAAACENVFLPTPHGGSIARFRACTMLISFAAGAGERAVFRSLLTALSFGQTTSGECAGSEWLAKLSERLLASLNPPQLDLVTVVLFVGSEAAPVSETLQAAVDRLHSHFGEKLAAIVLVSTGMHQFTRVRGLTGFVTAANGDFAWAARTLFMSLAMFTAPRTLNGLDLYFLLPLLGTVSEPSVLIEALWFRDGSGRLEVASQAGEQVLRQSNGIAAIALPTSKWGLNELGRFINAVREIAVEPATTLIFAADDAVAEGLLSTSVFTVLILCT